MYSYGCIYMVMPVNVYQDVNILTIAGFKSLFDSFPP